MTVLSRFGNYNKVTGYDDNIKLSSIRMSGMNR